MSRGGRRRWYWMRQGMSANMPRWRLVRMGLCMWLTMMQTNKDLKYLYKEAACGTLVGGERSGCGRRCRPVCIAGGVGKRISKYCLLRRGQPEFKISVEDKKDGAALGQSPGDRIRSRWSVCEFSDVGFCGPS